MSSLTFTIDASETKVDDLKAALEKLDIRFDPRRQLIAFNESLMDTAVAMGHHTSSLIEAINEQLQRANLTPPVPTDHQDWPLERQMAFLEFAMYCFDWVDHDIQNSWWHSEGMSWAEVVKDHPMVFTGTN